MTLQRRIAVDADEEPQQEWETEDDVKGEPLDPQKKSMNFWKSLKMGSS